MTEYSNMWPDAPDFIEIFWRQPMASPAEQQPASESDADAEYECINDIVWCYQG